MSYFANRLLRRLQVIERSVSGAKFQTPISHSNLLQKEQIVVRDLARIDAMTDLRITQDRLPELLLLDRTPQQQKAARK